jgi:hypothetical protein
MKRRAGILFLFVFFIPGLIFAQQRENMTITTYFPPPYGSFYELQLYPHATPVAVCNAANEGMMYYSSTADTIMVCSCLNPPCAWVSMSDLWTYNQTRNSLYPNDESWNVTIGNNTSGFTPEAQLTVIARSNPTLAEPDRYSQFQIRNNASLSSKKLFLGIDTTDDYAGLAYVNDAPGTSHWGPLVLQAHGGGVGIGKTDPYGSLNVVGTIRLRANDGDFANYTNPNAFSAKIITGNSTERYMAVTVNGTPGLVTDPVAGVSYWEPNADPYIKISRNGTIIFSTGVPSVNDGRPGGNRMDVRGRLSAARHNMWPVQFDEASSGPHRLPRLNDFISGCTYNRVGGGVFPVSVQHFLDCTAACNRYCQANAVRYSGGIIALVNPHFVDGNKDYGVAAGCLCSP